MDWFLAVWPLILAMYHLINMVKDMNQRTKVKIPHQLVELVELAHGVSEVAMMFDIRVSERMRDALCAPLTPEQIATIRSAEKGVYRPYVKCKLLSSRYGKGELSGVVQVSLRVSSRYSEKPLVFPDVKLKITVSSMGKTYIEHRWEVTSVEQIA